MDQENDKTQCFSYEVCANWDIKWSFRDESYTKTDSKDNKNNNNHHVAASNSTIQLELQEAIQKLESSYYEKKYDNNSISSVTIVPKSEQKRIKSIRKLAEKTIKTLKIKLSDISKELQEDKNSMKLWFRKKLESHDENARILDKTTKWTLQKIMNVEMDDFLKIISKFTKSFQKEEGKKYKIDDPSTIQKNTFVVCPTPPGEQQIFNNNYPPRLVYKTNAPEETTSLVYIEINLDISSIIGNNYLNGNSSNEEQKQQIQENDISIENPKSFLDAYPQDPVIPLKEKLLNTQLTKKISISPTSISSLLPEGVIKEKILWDITQSDSKYILSSSYHLLKDFLKEYDFLLQHLQAHHIQDLWMELCKQISTQLKDKQILSENAKTVCQFTSSDMTGNQKEHFICINIIIRHFKTNQIIHQEQVEWDIISDINSAEIFAEILIQDLGLEKMYIYEVAKQIRDQINTYLIKRTHKIGKYFPEFSKDISQEQWSRSREKEFMSKHISLTINEDISLMPENYQQDNLPVFTNSEMFNLIKTNLDIMPPQFQEKLCAIEKQEEANRVRSLTDRPILNIDNAMKQLDSINIVSSNPYIPQILKESKLLSELEGELTKKRALYNNPILAGHKK